ncbi:uncharacterized protein LOC143049971 [Mytilus galloprovincialis]|uniref:uncharacterized protein LOC143049971 n=1 Tax=Mytilus galloprovincialis TaxID=29158 RepID=UPI003F7C56DB
MRLFHLVFVAYSVTILTKDIYARKGKACKNGNKRTLSWRLKLLRKVSKQLNPRIKLLSLKGRINSDLEKDKAHGWIKESESKQRHVPRIECNKYEGSEDLIACPTPDAYQTFYCIEDRHLCDQQLNCPNGEDENLIGCMFFKWANSFFRKIEEALINKDRRL